MTSLDKLKSSIISQFGTPCSVIDLDVMEKNILRAQKICDAAGVANRGRVHARELPRALKKQLASGVRY